MGLNLGSLVSTAIGAVSGFATGGPAGAFIGATTANKADLEKRRIEKQLKQREQNIMAMDFGGPATRPTFVDPYAGQLVPNRGLGEPSGFFSTLRSGLKEAGGFVSDVFSTGIPQLFGVGRPSGVGQQPAITTVTNVGAQETQGSGSIQAGVGSLLPTIVGAGRNLLKSPMGQLALGTGTGVALSGFGGQKTGMRITRKMKSQARMVLNMTNGNLSAAADILNISEDVLVMILLKRFRNDGPVVTKAALRKTKQTVRRLKNMCDMYDSLRPRAAARRAPARRTSSTTLIKN